MKTRGFLYIQYYWNCFLLECSIGHVTTFFPGGTQARFTEADLLGLGKIYF